MEDHCSYRNYIHQHVCGQTCSYYQLSKCGWYWGGITSQEARELLAEEEDKVFLVRDSSDAKHILCISYRCGGRIWHARFEHANGLYSLDGETFVPPTQLSEYCTTVKVESTQLNVPIKLTKPLNRFAKLDSLQMICRFVIRKSVPENAWDRLPLPPYLISYVTRGSDYSCTS